MIIIGEKINMTIPAVKKAVEEKNEDYIRNLAVKQVEAGADYIDVCAGTTPEKEVKTLLWLMDLVQDAVDAPLCIDSPNARTIERVFARARKPGIINSVSEEGDKCEIIFPLMQDTGWQVIALANDSKGIPSAAETRVSITGRLVEKAAKYSIATERIHLDPLVLALSTENQSVLKFIQVMKTVKELFPEIKVTSGLSNISFGMPLRKVVNQNFLAIAIYEGMDSAVLDPLDRNLMASLLATEALLGRDSHCRNFLNAYRTGKVG